MPTCYELRIPLNETEREKVSSALIAKGISNFVEGELNLEHDLAFANVHEQEQLFEENASAILDFVVYSEDKAWLSELLNELHTDVQLLEISTTLQKAVIQPIANQDWRESWKHSFKPVLVGNRCAVLPPWEDPRVFEATYKIIINPGLAFGTGQHETTKLCLELFFELKDQGHLFRSCLDVGCGSGILSIAAKMTGIDRVVGFDIDPASISVAEENARLNTVEGIIFLTGTAATLHDSDFELGFINIEFAPHVSVFPFVQKMGQPGATWITSGILAEQSTEYENALSKVQLQPIMKKQRGDWLGYVLQQQK